MSKVSVLLPNYNHAKYLKQRIESILYQTFQDFDIIILDDCSSDNSKEIIELFRNHPKVSQIVYNEKNSGSTFKQWQKGLRLAKGDFIWIAESDDWAENNFLEKTYSKFLEDNQLGIVYTNSNMYVNDVLTTTLSDVKTNILKNNKWSTDYIHDGNYELNDSLVLCCSINNASAVLFNKTVLLNACPFDLDFRYLGDWYCYLKIASISKIGYINEPLNNYRDHSENVSKKASFSLNHLKEYFLVYNWIIKHVIVVDKKQMMSFFYGYTMHDLSLFNPEMRQKYTNLYKINKKLFIYMIVFNIKKVIIAKLKKIKKNYLKP
jgi:glycosyltransferase involved in cell wall biosynthesis